MARFRVWRSWPWTRAGRRAGGLASLLLGLAGCGSGDELHLLVPPDPQARAIGEHLAAVLGQEGGFEIRVSVGQGSVANLERVAEGSADLTLVENNAEHRPGVRSLLPLYRGVLHVLHEPDASPGNAIELLSGKRIFAGAPGGMGEWFLSTVTRELGIPSEDYELLAPERVEEAQVLFVFAPISPAVSARIEGRFAFFSIGAPESLGRGSIVEGISLDIPQMEPFLIPARTYGAVNPEPVLTASVDTLLVLREGISEHLAFDLAEAIVDLKPQIARAHPSLFLGIREDFDLARLNFPLHEGARSFLRRDEPGFFERYAELVGVSFSISLAVVSAVFGLVRWRERRRKDRIDRYYAEVLRIRVARSSYGSAPDFDRAIARIEALEAQAFEELMAERLAADDSFRIFTTFCTDTVQELRRRRGLLASEGTLASAASGG